MAMKNLDKYVSDQREQGVSCSQKFRGRRGFPNLANRTSQFMFPKNLIEYQHVKLVISKFKNKISNKNKKKN